MPPASVNPHEYSEYGAIAIVAFFSVALVFIIFSLVHFITRTLNKIPSPDSKLATYECGEAPVGDAWVRINPRFFTIALIFIVFEVELVLILPVLMRFAHYIGLNEGQAVFLKIFLFAGTLMLGLLYSARKGDFSWNKVVTASPAGEEKK